MSASLKTTNYELGIYAPNDVTSWLTDFNGNMNKIDAQMKANANGVQGNVGDINALTGRMTTAENDIEQLENEYRSMIEKTSSVPLVGALTSNTSYIAGGIITNKALLGAHVETIDKNGESLSVIDIDNSSKKFLPLINKKGNPLNLKTITSPTENDFAYVGDHILNYNSNGTGTIRSGAFLAYYNGTNTLFGITVPTSLLTSTNYFNINVGGFNYII